MQEEEEKVEVSFAEQEEAEDTKSPEDDDEQQQQQILDTTATNTQRFIDHCSLSKPSSQIRFRGNSGHARVYPDARGQFIFEESSNNDEVIAKWVDTYNGKLKFLRGLYTFVTFFWTGFLVVVSIELLLYLILDFTIAAGVTNKQENAKVFEATGVVLALPLYVYGMASALVVAAEFVRDTWNGHLLMNQLVFLPHNKHNNNNNNSSSVLTEWIEFWMFLGIPLFCLVITIIARSDYWWEITSMVWFTTVSLSYLAFGVVLVYYEFRANWQVTRNHITSAASTTTTTTTTQQQQQEEEEDPSSSSATTIDRSYWATFQRAVFLRQRHIFGGVEKKSYLIKGELDHKKKPTKKDDDNNEDDKEGDRLEVRASRVEKREELYSGKTWYTHIISLKLFERLGMFVPLEEPERQFTMGDVQDMRGFVTRDTWSLESMYCRPRNSRYVTVLGGPQAITPLQIRSSIACSILANLIYVLLFVAFLVWLGLPAVGIVILTLVFVAAVLFPAMRHSYRLTKMTQERYLFFTKDNDDDDDNDDEENKKKTTTTDYSTTNTDNNDTSIGVFQVWESHRIITLTETFCWVVFGLELFFFFLWPFLGLILLGNAATSSIFFVICVFSWTRSYFNAAIVLEETGTMPVDGAVGSMEYWQNVSRLNTIVTKVTRSKGKAVWMTILIIVVIILLAMGIMSVDTTPVSGQNVQGDTDFLTYLPDYEYKGNEGTIPYPTCSFGKDFSISTPSAASFGVSSERNSTRRDLADYAFLAALGYTEDSIVQYQLDQWFAFENRLNRRNVTNHPEGVQAFRQSINSQSPVVYKAIDIPITTGNADDNKVDVMVVIRGSKNTFDFLTDAQLWFAAMLFQTLRFVLPFGNVWTPIMHHLIEAISWLESSSLAKISFYTETTDFIQWIQQEENKIDLELLYGGSIQNVEVTGHSLGAGLAFISAAQANVRGVGVSGPNAMLSRSSFHPPFTKEDLNENTFNIVPDHDIIPRCDDLAQNFQKIRCLADTGTFTGDAVACHGDGKRSLCELLYQCGTHNRPAICECHYEFGYPKPTLRKNRMNTNDVAPLEEQCAAVIDKMNKN